MIPQWGRLITITDTFIYPPSHIREDLGFSLNYNLIMDLNKLTKKELVDYADSQGISVNIKDKKEFLVSKIKTLEKSKPKRDPIWVSLTLLIIFILVAYYWFLPLLIQFHLALIVAACLVASWLIEIKLTSDMKFTGIFSIIFVLVFFYSGAAGWDWSEFYLI